MLRVFFLNNYKYLRMFKDKVLLITGGTGSFGNAVLRKFLSLDIKEIRIFSRDEKKQDNIVYYKERVDDDKLIEFMNKFYYHLCPSEAEGFGHYINEALSCKSIVVTTNPWTTNYRLCYTSVEH